MKRFKLSLNFTRKLIRWRKRRPFNATILYDGVVSAIRRTGILFPFINRLGKPTTFT